MNHKKANILIDIPANYQPAVDLTPSMSIQSHQDTPSFDVTLAIGVKTKTSKFDVYVEPTINDGLPGSFREFGLGIEGTATDEQGVTVHAFLELWDVSAMDKSVVSFGMSVLKPFYKGIQIGGEVDNLADDTRIMAIGEKDLGHFAVSGGLGVSNLADYGASDQSKSSYKPFITEKITLTTSTDVSIFVEGKHWIGQGVDEVKAGILVEF